MVILRIMNDRFGSIADLQAGTFLTSVYGLLLNCKHSVIMVMGSTAHVYPASNKASLY